MVRSIVHEKHSVVPPVRVLRIEHLDQLEHEQKDGSASVWTSVGCEEHISI